MEITLFFFLLLPLILSTTLILITKNSRRKTQNLLPPGPSPLPWIGNFHQLDSTPPHEYFWRLSKKYGALIYMKLGFRPVLIANSAKMAEEILKNQDLQFCSRPPLLALRKVSYNGFNMAFAPYGEYWREMRKICILNFLSAARVKFFRPIREDEVSRMIHRIQDNISGSETVNLTEVLTFLTSTTICRVAFGKRYEPGTGESKEFNTIIREFQDCVAMVYVTDYFPKLGWIIDKVMGKIDNLEKVCKKWDLFYQKLIDEHLLPDRPKSMDGDVIDILLNLQQSQNYDLPLDHIKAVLVDVYFASTDTIATTMIWAMTCLIKNPSAMKKVQAELRRSIGKKEMVKEEDIATTNLPYLTAVIKETLRMYSTIPLLVPRETTEKCIIDGYEIPAKTLVHVNVWAINRDPESWENPNEFMPERFLEGGKSYGRELKGHDYGFAPFGAGRRSCPGITMAMATVETVLANLLYLFDWEPIHGQDVDSKVSPGLTLHKKYPLCLNAKNYM